jgi:hypothetical protein
MIVDVIYEDDSDVQPCSSSRRWAPDKVERRGRRDEAVKIPQARACPLVEAIDAWARRLEGGAGDLPRGRSWSARWPWPRARAAGKRLSCGRRAASSDAVGFGSPPGVFLLLRRWL